LKSWIEYQVLIGQGEPNERENVSRCFHSRVSILASTASLNTSYFFLSPQDTVNTQKKRTIVALEINAITIPSKLKEIPKDEK
jgi:hypothetical protein